MSMGPVIVSLAAVAAGAALGLLRHRERWLGPIRTFGLVSVLGLILVLLLPEALSGLGLVAIGVIALGFLLPAGLDRIERRFSSTHRHLGAEVGYAMILIHQVADGLALASESAEIHGAEHWDALIAMSVHTIPLTTVVVVTFNHLRGPSSALLRAAGIAVATLVGVFSLSALPGATVAGLHPWLAAAVSGMLLHIIAQAPKTNLSTGADRARDAAAALGGVALIAVGVFGTHHHSAGGAAFSERLMEAFVAMSLTTAPALLFGLSAGAAIAAFGAPVPKRWLASPRVSIDALRGALIGAPLPVCSCGVLPVTQGLRRRGASSAFVLAFLVATPEIGIDAIVVSAQFLGWELTLVRVLAALVLAIAAGFIGAKIAARSPTEKTAAATACCSSGHNHEHHSHDHAPPTRWRRFITELDELIFHIGPWTVLGLVVAAYAEAVLPTGGWASTQSGIDIFVITFLAIPSYICAASMTPLAAVLLLKGFSPGAVLAGLLLGPATNVATFAFVRSELGRRGVLLWTAAIILITWTLAMGINFLDAAGAIAPIPPAAMAHDHGAAWYSVAAALMLVGLMSRGIWRVGFSRWVSSLGDFMALIRRRPATADA
ncbi:MAG: permease [Myxococcota bacterium]